VLGAVAGLLQKGLEKSRREFLRIGEGTAKLVIDNLAKRLEKIKLPATTADAGTTVVDAGTSD